MRIMREPLDGPVLLVAAVDTLDEAIALAELRATTASAHRSGRRTATMGLRVARELHAGMVWLNDHLPAPMVSRGPWGAAAGSGAGAHAGAALAFSACAQEKLITWDPAEHARAVVGPV